MTHSRKLFSVGFCGELPGIAFMRRPVQRKYATEVAHGPRGEQRTKNPPLLD